MAKQNRLGLAAIITACVFWGGSFFFGKVALREMTALEVVWWRFVLAIALLAPMLVLLSRKQSLRNNGGPVRRKIPSRGDLGIFLLNALLMVPIQFVLQFEGLARTSASSASLLVGVFAPMMALGGVLVAGERLRWSGWMAVVLSTLGVAVMVGLPGEGRTLTGDLMVVGSLVCAVCMVLVTQRLLRKYDALSITVWSMAVGTVMLLPWIVAVQGFPGMPATLLTWSALAGLGFGCTALSFGLWNWGLKFIPASHAGVYVNIEPLIGAILGVVVLHEAMNGGLVVGGALILAAALIISWPRRTPKVPAEMPVRQPENQVVSSAESISQMPG